MTNELIVGLCTLAGSVLGSAATLISANLTNKRSELRTRLFELARQVQAYHKLEELYKVALANELNKPPDTIMKDMRDKVEQSEGYTRPKMTQREAKNIIEKM